MTTITLPRAVVEQALEALESVYGDSCDALHALRAALAQQGEPLTDKEIDACRQQGYAHAGLSAPFDFGKAARAVERKVRGEERC